MEGSQSPKMTRKSSRVPVFNAGPFLGVGFADGGEVQVFEMAFVLAFSEQARSNGDGVGPRHREKPSIREDGGYSSFLYCSSVRFTQTLPRPHAFTECSK
jgi:hypothetical protein